MVLVNDQDEVVGYREKFAAHKNPVPLHRAISIMIFSRDQKRILLQKRAKIKPTWPEFWSNAVCTHPLPKEDYQNCAERRLKEELGFETHLKRRFSFIYSAKYDSEWGEHEYDVVFWGVYEGEVKPNPNEVSDWKWMEAGELLNDVRENPQIYTPWFKIILQRWYEVSGISMPEVFVKHLE